MNFFTLLSNARIQNIDIKVINKDGGMVVLLSPKSMLSDAKFQRIPPISLSGTPEEIDAEIEKALKPLSAVADLIIHTETMENWKAETEGTKTTKARTTKAKAAEKPKEAPVEKAPEPPKEEVAEVKEEVVQEAEVIEEVVIEQPKGVAPPPPPAKEESPYDDLVQSDDDDDFDEIPDVNVIEDDIDEIEDVKDVAPAPPKKEPTTPAKAPSTPAKEKPKNVIPYKYQKYEDALLDIVGADDFDPELQWEAALRACNYLSVMDKTNPHAIEWEPRLIEFKKLASK